jgi:hypothetical protein
LLSAASLCPSLGASTSSGHLIMVCSQHGVQIGGAILDAENGSHAAKRFLEHIDKGGTFEIGRVQVGPTQWKTAVLNIHLSGRMILFKTVNKQQRGYPLHSGTRDGLWFRDHTDVADSTIAL